MSTLTATPTKAAKTYKAASSAKRAAKKAFNAADFKAGSISQTKAGGRRSGCRARRRCSASPGPGVPSVRAETAVRTRFGPRGGSLRERPWPKREASRGPVTDAVTLSAGASIQGKAAH